MRNHHFNGKVYRGIGCFQPSHKLVQLSRLKTNKYHIKQPIKFLLALCLLSLPPTNVMSSYLLGRTMLNSTWHPGIMGLDSKSINKMCHVIYGNKKDQGLTFASWNCGRALSQKIEDIKLFI